MTRSALAARGARGWPPPLLVAGCAGSGARSAPPAPDAAEAELPPPARQVLRNGMRLIVQDHRAADIVAIYLFVGVGVRYETPDQLGYAHFQEHMLFKGTDKFGPGYIDRTVEGVGGRSNAVTSFDYTTFYLSCPSEATATGLELLADMAFRSTFAPEEIGREREVIFEEARIEQDNPRSAIVRQLYGLVFAGHPYGRPVLGTPRDDEGGHPGAAARLQPPVLHAGEHDAGGGGAGGAGRGARHGGPRVRAACRPTGYKPPPAPAARAAHRRGAARRWSGRSSRRTWPSAGRPRARTTPTATRWTCSPRSSRAPRARAWPSGCATRSGWSRA